MPAPDEQGRRLALIIASSDYQDPALQRLRAPGRDASDLAEVLRDPAIGTFDVRTLINTPNGQLQRGIARFCHQAGPGDLVLFYLSCHGVLDDRGRLYYATIDTERVVLSATAVAAQWLNDQLEDCRARRQILLLDCCHSGAFAKGSKGDDVLALKERFSGRGKVVLTASGATEYSFEGATPVGEDVRSVFTRAVVDGLRTGQADRDKDGLITVEDLYHYVFDTVRAAEPRQTPELWAFGAEGDLLVAHSPRGPIIEPAPLPEDLRLTLENSRPVVRESGVKVLADLLDHGEPGLALTARLTLQRISEEDLPRIAALARAAHDAGHGQAVTQLEAHERARREAEEEARRQEAERAAAQRQQQVEQLQAQVRDHAAAQDWDAVLAVSDQLAALDPAAADPDALASTARKQITRRHQAEQVVIDEQARREAEEETGATAKEERSDARQSPATGRAIPGALDTSASDVGRRPARQRRRTSAKALIFGGASVGIVLAAVLITVILANSHTTLSFRDDFSRASGWTVGGLGASGRYSNGKYQIYVKPAKDSFGYATPDAPDLNPAPSSITIEVSARPIVGAADVYYGIACRLDYSGTSDYEFQINQGYAQIIKYVNGNGNVLAGSNTTAVRANGTNQLRAACTGAGGQNAVHLVFWVNGKKLYDVTDRTNPFASGMVGLVAERVSGTKDAFAAEFGNFAITQS